MHPDRPYLSVVVAGRNDDHGANFLRRVQTFVNALIGQAKRHALPMELILVDWNPPDDRPPLAEALRWPADTAPCRIRAITVPPEIHRRYQHAEALPLYQMIAKNAGIRRAEGEFILATNIDILLSNALMEFLAARQLEPGRMYRIDRHDVETDVPVDAPVDEQLEYCRTHSIRLNAREGTFGLTPGGLRRLAPVDVAPPDSGIFFGAGWYPPEQHFGQVFRWAADDVEIAAPFPPPCRTILMEIEPGPGVGSGPFKLRLTNFAGNAVAEAQIDGRSAVHIRLPGDDFRFRLSAASGGRRSVRDPRTLNFRVFRCEWSSDPASSLLTATKAPKRRVARARETARQGLHFLSQQRQNASPTRIGLPLSGRLLERLQVRAESGGLSIALGGKTAPDPVVSPGPAELHTNACGDFTLLHRRHWLELRGYPEFDLYSMNLDSVFCYAAHYGGAAELTLAEPMRIYHIEHSAGSGWTPEGHTLLFQRLAEKGIPWLDFQEAFAWAAQMERLKTTFVFNRDDWGLSEFSLPEDVPSPRDACC